MPMPVAFDVAEACNFAKAGFAERAIFGGTPFCRLAGGVGAPADGAPSKKLRELI
jgi:hypothetical protein